MLHYIASLEARVASSFAFEINELSLLLKGLVEVHSIGRFSVFRIFISEIFHSLIVALIVCSLSLN